MSFSHNVKIGQEFPPFIIAEVSGNHNGSLERAKKLIEVAAHSGATAVKFQTYTAETMTLNIDSDEFRVSADHQLWGGKTLYELYDEAHTPWEWHETLFEHAKKFGILAFSTPFDLTAVDFLESLEVPLYKIASLEINDHELIEKAASTGKPIILSTGAASLDEAKLAIKVAKESGASQVIALKCTSSYPSDPRDANLNALKTLRTELDVEVGLSDHTLGTSVSVAAIALGASVIEKHITLDRNDGGVDSAFSLTPVELNELVSACNVAFSALGDSAIRMRDAEQESHKHKRSLYVSSDVKQGEVASRENVRSIRPGGGLPPYMISKVLGKKFARDFNSGQAVTLEIFE